MPLSDAAYWWVAGGHLRLVRQILSRSYSIVPHAKHRILSMIHDTLVRMFRTRLGNQSESEEDLVVQGIAVPGEWSDSPGS